MRPGRHSTLLALALGALATSPAVPGHDPLAGQETIARVTADDYARAERFLSGNLNGMVLGGSVSPTWVDENRFWYRNAFGDGVEFVLVDVEAGTRERAFDHAALARALSDATGEQVERFDLPFRGLDALEPGRSVTVEADEERWICDLRGFRCDRGTGESRPDRAEVLSPDGRRAVFIREHDLWVREVATGRETRLTTDGIEDFGYGTNNAGWTRSDRPVVRWSPDSRRIATFQHDARGVGFMHLVTTEVGHPELDSWRYPLPEDTVIFRVHRVVIDVDAPGGPAVTRLRMPPDPHRSTTCDHIACGGTFADVEWSDDGSTVAFVSSSRDHKRATLREADAVTGEVRDVLEERVETFYESGFRSSNWRYFPDREEVMWYSHETDWGHLYLHDLRTGARKHAITSGDWNVLDVVKVDREAGTLWFIGNEREPGDPYFRYLYRVDFDGSDLELLTPDSADHDVELSPDGRHFVVSRSTPVEPPVAVVLDLEGDEVMEVERADISRLRRAGWVPPIPFSVKARDGVTDLYGLMFRPTDFDPAGSYPIINYIYPGPQTGSVGSRSFSAARRDHQAMAELGFVVVALDAMGTPMRSKSFHAAYYGDMGDNGLPDQVGGMRQLAERHPWIDLERAGIWGHSGGGFASTGAIFRYPDFFKVAVSQAGNHDNRNYEDDWAEKWHGLLEVYPDGTTSYDSQANQLLAENLEGKLLLAHGTLDDNVPPSNTLLVVDALIRANKDFDLIMFPNRRHGFGFEDYMVRRRWDYFVEHLMGAEPPEEYEFGTLGDGR